MTPSEKLDFIIEAQRKLVEEAVESFLDQNRVTVTYHEPTPEDLKQGVARLSILFPPVAEVIHLDPKTLQLLREATIQ